MTKFDRIAIVGLVALAFFTGFFFDGYQTNGDFRITGDVYGTKWNGIKVYRALITQSGTGAPTATVLENTLGGTITFSRVGAGFYTVTSSGLFTVGKTFMSITENSSFAGTAPEMYVFQISYVDVNSINIDSFEIVSSTSTDDQLFGTPVEILVYP